MDYNEEKFKEHIKAVVEASQVDETIEERPLTIGELKELAISMGLNEEEWNALQLKADVHLKSADDHLRMRNFTEAISEANQATAINPYIENGNAVLAKSYLMLWLQSHENEHRDKAEFHARKELKVDPRDQIAVNVLSTIDKKRKVLEYDTNSKKRVLIIAGIVILSLIILLIFSFGNSPSSVNTSNSNSEAQVTTDFTKNQLIESEENVLSKWDYVQTAIDRRNALIPQLILAINSSSEEARALNETIEQLQEKISLAEGEERFALENDLNATIAEAKVLLRASGESEAVNNLMMEIESSENRIAFEKKTYNEAVKSYNILVKKNQEKYPEYEVMPYFSSK